MDFDGGLYRRWYLAAATARNTVQAVHQFNRRVREQVARAGMNSPQWARSISRLIGPPPKPSDTVSFQNVSSLLASVLSLTSGNIFSISACHSKFACKYCFNWWPFVWLWLSRRSKCHDRKDVWSHRMPFSLQWVQMYNERRISTTIKKARVFVSLLWGTRTAASWGEIRRRQEDILPRLYS